MMGVTFFINRFADTTHRLKRDDGNASALVWARKPS